MDLIPTAWPETGLFRPALCSRVGKLMYVSGLLFDDADCCIAFAQSDLLPRIRRQRLALTLKRQASRLERSTVAEMER